MVGHSLGGGIALQFAYQFPEYCERLVLVSSGGLGKEVHPLLRAAALPGAELVLPLITGDWAIARRRGGGRASRPLGLAAGPDLAEAARGYASLADRDAREAFLHTLRAVSISTASGSAPPTACTWRERLPTLMIWGTDDPIIPIEHGPRRASSDPRKPPGRDRRARALAAARRSGPLRRRAHRVRRDHRALQFDLDQMREMLSAGHGREALSDASSTPAREVAAPPAVA